MGIISIGLKGSFTEQGEWRFSAQSGGHAKAVAQAIEFLAEHVLPQAIKKDHALQKEGLYPDDRFGLDLEEGMILQPTSTIKGG